MVLEYIQGEKFISLQDNERVYYRHTHEVNEFLKDSPLRPFVLISHNSDGKVTDNPTRCDDADIRLMPYNLIRWYGQNVDVIDDRIESVPIGLENSRWFRGVEKILKMRGIIKTEKQMRNLVYLNVNVRTNPGVRQPLYDILSSRRYVTVDHGKNPKNFGCYLDNLYNHCFMVCPEGNGIDVHQPWEAMYINTIPIQKKNINNANWRELPVCWLDDWAQMEDEAFLWSEYERIKGTGHDMSKLYFGYWRDKILST